MHKVSFYIFTIMISSSPILYGMQSLTTRLKARLFSATRLTKLPECHLVPKRKLTRLMDSDTWYVHVQGDGYSLEGKRIIFKSLSNLKTVLKPSQPLLNLERASYELTAPPATTNLEKPDSFHFAKMSHPKVPDLYFKVYDKKERDEILNRCFNEENYSDSLAILYEVTSRKFFLSEDDFDPKSNWQVQAPNHSMLCPYLVRWFQFKYIKNKKDSRVMESIK